MLSLHPSVEVVMFKESCQLRLLYESYTISGGKDLFSGICNLMAENKSVTETELDQYLTANLGNQESVEEVKSFLMTRNVIVENPSDALTSDYDMYIDHLKRSSAPYLDFDDKTKRLHRVEKINISVESLFRRELADQLQRKRFTIEEDPLKSDFILMVFNGSSRKARQEANRNLLEYKLPFLVCSLDRQKLEIGPLVLPGESACYTCMQMRMFSNLQYKDEYIALENEAFPSTIKTDFILMDYATNRIVNEIVKFTIGDTRLNLVGKLMEADMLTGEVNFRPVHRVPRCIDCSNMTNKPLLAVRDLL